MFDKAPPKYLRFYGGILWSVLKNLGPPLYTDMDKVTERWIILTPTLNYLQTLILRTYEEVKLDSLYLPNSFLQYQDPWFMSI